MAEIMIDQQEADALIAMPKVRINEDPWDYPGMGGAVNIPLTSDDRREHFLLDIWRSGNISMKGRYQNRARQAVILVRLEFGGSPHRNPDGVEVPSPHLHIYR